MFSAAQYNKGIKKEVEAENLELSFAFINSKSSHMPVKDKWEIGIFFPLQSKNSDF